MSHTEDKKAPQHKSSWPKGLVVLGSNSWGREAPLSTHSLYQLK